MKIYDCVIYNGEDHLLEIRLNELSAKVDFFVIVESDISFSGIKKSYRFNPDRFTAFKDKIRYVPIGDVKSKRHSAFEELHWQREWGMRDSVIKGLYDSDPNDIIILSDIDELPVFDSFDDSDVFIFKQIGCQFKFNLRNPGLDPFYGSQAIKFKHLGYPSEFRMFNEKHHGIKKYDQLVAKQITGGFHFSFCMSNEKILEKLKFYSHHERLSEASLNINFTTEHIDQCVKDRKDIFGGRFNYAQQSTELALIPNKILPKYVQQNMEKFKDYLA